MGLAALKFVDVAVTVAVNDEAKKIGTVRCYHDDVRFDARKRNEISNNIDYHVTRSNIRGKHKVEQSESKMASCHDEEQYAWLAQGRGYI